MQRSSSGEATNEFASHAKNEVWYDLQLVCQITFVKGRKYSDGNNQMCVLCQKTKFIYSVLKLL